ncbi:hypothetical protein Tco_0456503 [Tanacetum coccineum]
MLDSCYGFELLDITNKSVKNLVFSEHDAPYMHSVEINAPYILSLTIEGGLRLEKLLLRNVSSVIKADLDCYKAVLDDESWEMHNELLEEMLRGLLFSLGHAKEVKIGELCLEALAGLKAKGIAVRDCLFAAEWAGSKVVPNRSMFSVRVLAGLKAKGFICPSNLKVVDN